MDHDVAWAIIALTMYFLGLACGVYYVARPVRRHPASPLPAFRSQLPTLTGIDVPKDLIAQCRGDRNG